MDSGVELDNGLPRYFTDFEIAQMEDRLLQTVAEPGSATVCV